MRLNEERVKKKGKIKSVKKKIESNQLIPKRYPCQNDSLTEPTLIITTEMNNNQDGKQFGFISFLIFLSFFFKYT
jgi:hypothetical protein